MIGFNVQPLASENLTGIGNYAADVLKCLINSEKDYEMHVFNFLGRNNVDGFLRKHIGKDFDSAKTSVVKIIPLSLYIRLAKLGRVLPYRKLTSSKADVTVFFNYLAPQGFKGKSVITIYDMVCERFPETMDDRNRKLLKRFLKKSAQDASAIVTISQFSKKEIVETLGVSEEKIFVAPCGIDVDFYKPSTDKIETENEKKLLKEKWDLNEYILYVGTLEPRKNVLTLIKAFNLVAKNNPDVKLVLTGGVGWHSEETLSAIENSPFKDRIVKTGYVSNEEKRMLYRNCKVFVFPSMYEGFGMPVTEAMACGAPCIVADTSSLPEISSSLAPLVDVYDFEKFSYEIEKALATEITAEARNMLVQNAARYSWENAAKVYNEAVDFAKSTCFSKSVL